LRDAGEGFKEKKKGAGGRRDGEEVLRVCNIFTLFLLPPVVRLPVAWIGIPEISGQKFSQDCSELSAGKSSFFLPGSTSGKTVSHSNGQGDLWFSYNGRGMARSRGLGKDGPAHFS